MAFAGQPLAAVCHLPFLFRPPWSQPWSLASALRDPVMPFHPCHLCQQQHWLSHPYPYHLPLVDLAWAWLEKAYVWQILHLHLHAFQWLPFAVCHTANPKSWHEILHEHLWCGQWSVACCGRAWVYWITMWILSSHLADVKEVWSSTQAQSVQWTSKGLLGCMSPTSAPKTTIVSGWHHGWDPVETALQSSEAWIFLWETPYAAGTVHSMLETEHPSHL